MEAGKKYVNKDFKHLIFFSEFVKLQFVILYLWHAKFVKVALEDIKSSDLTALHPAVILKNEDGQPIITGRCKTYNQEPVLIFCLVFSSFILLIY